MFTKSVRFWNYKFIFLLTIILSIWGVSVEASEDGMAVFFTIVTKAYCDKCVNGFSTDTAEGYRLWKHENGIGDSPIPETGDLGNSLKYLRETNCSVLSKSRDFESNACESLAEKFKVIQSGPDPKYRTSEATWKTYINALNRANRVEILSCFEASARTNYKMIIDSLTDSEMKKFAEDQKDIKLGKIIGNFQEGIVKSDGKSGIVRFVYNHGEWKISQM